MAKIRRLTLFDIKKLQELVSCLDFGVSSEEITESDFTPFPVDVLHDLLPMNQKFLQESYIAIEKNELLGLISVIPDGAEKTRWKINKLLLNTNSFDVGKQLVDFIVNKYGGAGTETIIAVIDEEYAEVIQLLRDVCMFRSCSQIQIWQLEDLNKDFEKYNSSNFRKSKRSDAPRILDLYQQALFPQFRHSLVKNKRDFRKSIFKSFLPKNKDLKLKRMVIEDYSRNSIEGHFTLLTQDGKNYWLDLLLSLPYLEYTEDIIAYCTNFIKQKNPDANLYIYLRKYLQGSPRQLEIFENLGLKCKRSQQVLVKDYWKPAKLAENEKKLLL